MHAIAQIFFALMMCSVVTSYAVPSGCQDPEYLERLRQEVRGFYDFYDEPEATGLSHQGPCSFSEGNQIARPRWPVSTLHSWHSQRSTCPWYPHMDEDVTGSRYPCRLFTAKLANSVSTVMAPFLNHVSQPCMRTPGSRHHRHQGKLCEPLLQLVPVVIKTGCQDGLNSYEIRNRTIAVGYTCTFERH